MSFNSTMVRLKELMLKFDGNLKDCFNSTMVRLKVDKYPGYHYTIAEFQFHNGSIKRETDFNDYVPNRIVSIPQWFD